MTKSSPHSSTDGIVSLALAGLLFSLYLFTASFVFLSNDEIFLFDFTESLAKHQSVWRSETAEIEWPGESITEPLLPVLAAPLYWWVNNFDGVGNVHGTMLFNPIVTALTGSLVFLYLRRLNFERSISILCTLAFGLTTLAWPYTKTFFREPLTVLLLFACAYFVLNWREAVMHNELGKRGWAILVLLTGLAGLFAKEAAAIGVPLLALLILPWLQTKLHSKRDWGIAAGIFILATVSLFAIFWLISTTGLLGGGRFDFANRLILMFKQIPIAGQGVLGFLFSPGKSLFVYSPILILALISPFVSSREQKWDTSWQLIFASAYILIYALVRGEVWFGGRNWGPRYLLPVIPFLIISTAPAMQVLIRSKSWWKKIWIPALLLSGIVAQMAGTFINLANYDDLLSKLTTNAAWTLAIWEPYYSPILGHWRLLLSGTPIDFVWLRATDTPIWVYPCLSLGLAAIFSVTLYLAHNRELQRRYFFLSLLLVPLLSLTATWFALRAVYYDQRYQGQYPALHQLNAALREIDEPHATIFLNNHAYIYFMFNYYKGNLWWYTLELNPKELYKEGEPKYAPSIDPETIANLNARSVVEAFAEANQKTIYLIMEHSLYTPGSPRPLEWWMSSRYYYHSVQEFSTTVRLVRFSSAIAPKPNAPPAHPTQYQFGEAIRLSGWDMQPDEIRFRPGATLNISTQWRALNKPNGDYKIALYLMSPSGSIVVQDDSIPLNTFWPTIAWNPNDVIRHNIAFIIPKDSAPGFYEIWTVMYNAADVKRLSVQDATGTAIRDHAVLATIEVTR